MANQHDYVISNDTGAAVRADINDALAAIVSQNDGASAPSTTYAYERWVDTTNGLIKRRNSGNSGWINDGSAADTIVVAKTAAYTVLPGDFGRLINCTSGTFSLSLTAAATMGDGHWFGVVNSGSGTITLDPNSTETIDGDSTVKLGPGEGCNVWCDGTGFYTIGRFDLSDLSTKSSPTTSDSVVIMDAADSSKAKTATFPILRGYIGGLTLSNDATTPNTKIDVAAGMATDSGNTTILSLDAGTIDCSTTGANALDTGSLAASTWYHAFAIGKTDGTSALLASTSATAPTMPSGYTLKRRIGSFKTDSSSHILAFTQVDDEFIWNASPTDIQVSSVGSSSRTLAAISVPLGVAVVALFTSTMTVASSTADAVLFTAPQESDQAVGGGIESFLAGPVSGVTASASGQFRYRTNTSSQIGYRASAGNVTGLTVKSHGWIDTRGRFA